MWSRAGRLHHHTASRSVELGTSTPHYLLQYAALRVGPINFNNRFNFVCVLFGFVHRMLSAPF